MAELQDFNPDAPYTGPTPDVKAFAQSLQDYLDGKPSHYDPRQGVPVGYKVEDGKVVPQSQWDQWGKGATEFFAGAAPTILTAGLGIGIPGMGPASAIGEGSHTSLLDDIFKGLDYGSKLVTPLSDILGGAAKSAQAQNNTSDQLKLALYNAQQNAQLGAKKFALTAPSARMKTALTAILPKYASPTTIQWNGPGSGLRGEIPTYSGGPKSVFTASKDPQYRQLGDQVMNDELLAQMKGGASGGNEDVSVGTPPAVGESSTGDNILGGAALTTSLLGAMGKLGLFKNKNTMQPGTDWNPEMG